MLDNLILGFSISLSIANLLYCFIGVILGTVVGILPGLGPAGMIAFLIPLSAKLDVTSAIIMLSGIYYGVAYGGTLTSVLMNVPGEVSTVVTCLDGYQMAKKGRAGPALGISAFGSFIASTFGIIGLTLLAPPLCKFALSFGPPEFAALMVTGLTLVTYLSSQSLPKALAVAAFGLILGTVGLDPVTGVERMNFGTIALMDGFTLVPIGMGLFGIAEVFLLAEESVAKRGLIKTSMKVRNLLPTKQDWKDSYKPIGRGTVLGFFLGLIPGGGACLSSFLSYALEKRISKHPEKFGTGAIEGVAGPESANNAGTSGAYLPLLTLGLPFNVVTALILAAFMVHGVTPGPLIVKNHPDVFWAVVTSMYIGNFMLLILNLPMIGTFVNILRVPTAVISPIIIVVCFLGAYSVSYNHMDVIVMVVFGLVGYLMKKFGYEPAPVLLAYILGPFLEQALRQTLIISEGSLTIFLHRPICVVMLSIAFLSLISPLFGKFYTKIKEHAVAEEV